MSLATPGLRSGVADGVTCSICVWGVSLFREPDAGNLPVRFDEREQETEPSQTGLRRRRESLVNSHRQTKATAPVLDSTPDYTQNPTGAARSPFHQPRPEPWLKSWLSKQSSAEPLGCCRQKTKLPAGRRWRNAGRGVSADHWLLSKRTAERMLGGALTGFQKGWDPSFDA
jgi:hypothetical protein